MRRLTPGVALLSTIGLACHVHYAAYASQASGDARAFANAEGAYERWTGAYGTPDCLRDPTGCVPGEKLPRLFDLGAQDQANPGYTYKFYPGPVRSTPGAVPAPPRLDGFAFVARPVEWGGLTKRAFCADATGGVFFTTDPETPDPAGGACPATWSALK